MTSAPASSSPRRSSRDRSRSGWPAVMYTTRARRPAARNSTKWRPRTSGEVVADANPIAVGVGELNDRSQVSVGSGLLLIQIDHNARVEKIPSVVADHAHDRSRDRLGNWIHRVHHG